MLKRALDLVLALIALLVLGSVMLLVAALVKHNLGSPVLFRHERPGLNGKPFVMFKFRTMREACDENGEPLPDGERLTRFGNWLRAMSLDELPELWNVIKGDMSLVGPRPLRMEYLLLYNEEQFRRHEVKPGVTGWAQINGRNALSWEEKFQLDVWYVDNRTLWLDIKIILETALIVVNRRGVCSDSHATMENFKGTVADAAGSHRAVAPAADNTTLHDGNAQVRGDAYLQRSEQ